MARLSILYPGTTPNYWLDGHPIEDWYWYLGMGKDEQRRAAQMIGEAAVGAYGAALARKPLPKSKPLITSSADETPDRKAFYKDEYVRKHIKRG